MRLRFWKSKEQTPPEKTPEPPEKRWETIKVAGVSLSLAETDTGGVAISGFVTNKYSFMVLIDELDKKLRSVDSYKTLFDIKHAQNNEVIDFNRQMLKSAAESTSTMDFEKVRNVMEDLSRELTPEMLEEKAKTKKRETDQQKNYSAESAAIRLATQETAKYYNAAMQCLKDHGIEVTEAFKEDLRTSFIAAHTPQLG